MGISSMFRPLEDSALKGKFCGRVRIFRNELVIREKILRNEGFTITRKSKAFNCDAFILLVNWSNPTTPTGKATELKKISEENSLSPLMG